MIGGKHGGRPHLYDSFLSPDAARGLAWQGDMGSASGTAWQGSKIQTMEASSPDSDDNWTGPEYVTALVAGIFALQLAVNTPVSPSQSPDS